VKFESEGGISSVYTRSCTIPSKTRTMRFHYLLTLCAMIVSLAACAPEQGAEEITMTTYYSIETQHGTMIIGLYDQTPGHRDNFSKLADDGFYDGTSFHRVIAGFMAQGGDPNSKDDDPMNDGVGGPGYTIPAEINPALFHKKGALAAARQGDQVNPERASSGSQFYVVHGQVTPRATLAQMESQMQAQDSTFTFSEEAMVAYETVGGTPFLDGQYTVFGEVVEGLDVLDAIATTPTARSTGQQVHPALTDQPIERVEMTVRRLPDYSPSN